jgi:hypothetical protein
MLAEITEATGWFRHRVLGFIATAGLLSVKNEADERVYRAA